jgi:hypothetical protein
MFDPPLAGLAVDLRRDADGRPEVSIKAGPDEYDFAVIETGTPRASPVAVGSPEAT